MFLTPTKAPGYSTWNLKSKHKNKTKFFNRITFNNRTKFLFACLDKDDKFVLKEFNNQIGKFKSTTTNKFFTSDKRAIFQKPSLIGTKHTILVNQQSYNNTNCLISFDVQNCFDGGFKYTLTTIQIDLETNKIKSVSQNLYPLLMQKIQQKGIKINPKGIIIEGLANLNDTCHIFLSAHGSQCHQISYDLRTQTFQYLSTISLSKAEFNLNWFSNGTNTIINIESREPDYTYYGRSKNRPYSFMKPPHFQYYKPKATLNKYNVSTNKWISTSLNTKHHMKFNCCLILKGSRKQNGDIIAVEQHNDNNERNIAAKIYLISQITHCIKSVNIKLHSSSKYRYMDYKTRKYHMIFVQNTNEESHEIILKGYIRTFFEALNNDNEMLYPPDYLVKIITCFYSNETIKIICDQKKTCLVYWTLHVDDVYKHIEK